MKFYFTLQFKMLNRQLSDFGLLPIIGYLLSILVFTGLSYILFHATEFASYIYILIAIGLVSKLSETRRNDFLKSYFSKKRYLQLRLLENLIVGIPFILFLICRNQFLSAVTILVTSGLIAFIDINNKFSFTIPTPFFRYPFEFVVGFRNTFFIFIGIYFLTFMAITVGNFNLGFFSILAVFIICMTFYSNPEREYYVWIFSINPNMFLFRKVKTAIIFSTLLTFPILLSMSFFFPEKIWIMLIFQCIGYFYLSTIILAKYSDFPNNMNFTQVILFALGCVFPPFLLILIPMFYSQSVYSLNKILK